MKKTIRYKCDYCGDLFLTEEKCLEHEDKHRRIYKANMMLERGHTLKEIQDKCNIWRKVPDYLENVTTDNCFVVSHWQCCDKPAYRIDSISLDGKVRLWGCGSWSGYYGNFVDLNSLCLTKPYPKEELFVDKRYGSGW